MPEPRHALFVYGTLRRRCRHPMALTLAAHGVYLGEAKIHGRLYDLGRYPAAVPSSAENEWVFGDLYEIDASTLAELDDYEDVESPQPSYFGRKLDEIMLHGGSSRQAFIYWLHGPLPPYALLIPSGQYDKDFSAG